MLFAFKLPEVTMKLRTRMRTAAIIAAVTGAMACGSGELNVGYPTANSGGGGGSSVGTAASYAGAMADSLKHGAIIVTVSSSETVSGSLTFVGGPTVPLTGTVDTASQQLTASGGGYSLTGFTFNGTLQGSYTGPNTRGDFAAASDSLTGMSHTVFCGTYTSTNGSGWLSMVVLSDGDTGGFAVQTTGSASSGSFTGTLSNSAFSGFTSQGAPVTGALSSDLQTITGSYSPLIGTTVGTGTFTASVGGC
jgi:hypothetical protein